MKLEWTHKALGDLVRLYAFLEPVAPDAAAKTVQKLVAAPSRVLDFPRIGQKLDAFAPREVRCIFIADYEMRYEIVQDTIFILRLWHTRENRSPRSD